MIKFKFKLDMSKLVDSGRIDAAFGVGHEALDSQVMMDTDPYVPYKTGALAASPMQAHKEPGLIEYRTPYAHRQYYGDAHKFNKSKHPQARARWFEYSKSVWLQKWVKVVENIINRKLRGAV